MTNDFLKILVCQKCLRHFELVSETKSEKSRVLFGSIKCLCSEFPIVEGIVIYKRNENIKLILENINKHDYGTALKLSLDYRPHLNWLLLATNDNAPYLFRLLGLIISAMAGTFNRKKITLFTLFNIAGKLNINKFWTTYVKHRFSATSFWCSLPFIEQVSHVQKFLLDIGCGMGLSSYIFSKRIPGKFIVCQNLEFSSLYIAKEFLISEANFICGDFSETQPFNPQTFDVIYSCDALQYIPNQEQTCKEIIRLLHKDGKAILTHNHSPMHQDFGGQGNRGDFFDPITAKTIFEKLEPNSKVDIINEELVYKSLFPSNNLYRNN